MTSNPYFFSVTFDPPEVPCCTATAAVAYTIEEIPADFLAGWNQALRGETFPMDDLFGP